MGQDCSRCSEPKVPWCSCRHHAQEVGWCSPASESAIQSHRFRSKDHRPKQRSHHQLEYKKRDLILPSGQTGFWYLCTWAWIFVARCGANLSLITRAQSSIIHWRRGVTGALLLQEPTATWQAARGAILPFRPATMHNCVWEEKTHISVRTC